MNELNPPVIGPKVKRLIIKHRISELEGMAIQERIDDGWDEHTINEIIAGLKSGEIYAEKSKMMVEYHYKEPKTPEEKQEQEVCLNRVYDRLFDEVMRLRRQKEHGQ